MGGQIRLHDGTVAVEATGEANLGSSRASSATSGAAARPPCSARSRDRSPSRRCPAARDRRRAIPSPVRAARARSHQRHDFLRRQRHPARGRIARVAGGEVTVGGRIALNGFAPGALSLTAVGEQMQLRYPEGFRSTRRRGSVAARRRERAGARRHRHRPRCASGPGASRWTRTSSSSAAAVPSCRRDRPPTGRCRSASTSR